MVYLDFGWLLALGRKDPLIEKHADAYKAALETLRKVHPKGPAPIAELIPLLLERAYTCGRLDAQKSFWQCGRCAVANDDGKLYCNKCGAKRDLSGP